MDYQYSIEAYDPNTLTARVLYTPSNSVLGEVRQHIQIPADIILDIPLVDQLLRDNAPLSYWRERVDIVTIDASATIAAFQTPLLGSTPPVVPEVNPDIETVDYATTPVYDPALQELVYQTRPLTVDEDIAQRKLRYEEINLHGAGYMHTRWSSDSIARLMDFLETNPTNSQGLAVKQWLKDLRIERFARMTAIKDNTRAFTEADLDFSSFGDPPYSQEEFLAAIGDL